MHHCVKRVKRFETVACPLSRKPVDSSCFGLRSGRQHAMPIALFSNSASAEHQVSMGVILYCMLSRPPLHPFLSLAKYPQIHSCDVPFETTRRRSVPLVCNINQSYVCNKSSLSMLSENAQNREETSYPPASIPCSFPIPLPACPATTISVNHGRGHLGTKPREPYLLFTVTRRPLPADLQFLMSLFHLQARDTQRPACSYSDRHGPSPRNLADLGRCNHHG